MVNSFALCLMNGIVTGKAEITPACGSLMIMYIFAVEADGSVYPCDFYVLDNWKLGNLRDDSFEKLREGACLQRFLQDSGNRPAECKECTWKMLCSGGCKRDWTWMEGQPHNYYCASFQKLFAHAMPRIQEIASAELHMRQNAYR